MKFPRRRRRQAAAVANTKSPRKKERKVPAGIKKKLIYANVVEDELQIAAKKSDEHKEVVVSLLKGKQLKRYRMKKHLSQQLNVSEKFLYTRKDKSLRCLRCQNSRTSLSKTLTNSHFIFKVNLNVLLDV